MYDITGKDLVVENLYARIRENWKYAINRCVISDPEAKRPFDVDIYLPLMKVAIIVHTSKTQDSKRYGALKKLGIRCVTITHKSASHEDGIQRLIDRLCSFENMDKLNGRKVDMKCRYCKYSYKDDYTLHLRCSRLKREVEEKDYCDFARKEQAEGKNIFK